MPGILTLLSLTRDYRHRADWGLSLAGWGAFFAYSLLLCFALNAFGNQSPACLQSVTGWFMARYGFWLIATPVIFGQLRRLHTGRLEQPLARRLNRLAPALTGLAVASLAGALVWQLLMAWLAPEPAQAPAIIVNTLGRQVAILAFTTMGWHLLLLPAQTASQKSDTGPERLRVQKGSGDYFLALEKIVSVRADGNYMDILTATDHYLLRSTMAELIQRLPADRFVRVHRSYVINLNHLTNLRPNGKGGAEALMDDGTRIPVSKGYRQKLTRQPVLTAGTL